MTNQIEVWRERFVTRWNRFECTHVAQTIANRAHGCRFCTSALRDALKGFEEAKIHGEFRPVGSLATILQTHDMKGFPLNMAFTNIEKVVDAVFNTGVHKDEDPRVEFALAVHLHAYPNGVFSLWVYVASLVSKR